ncbi:Ff.00g014360.m01.CDS01 [Fusarium sp. VM40]|nr:Ff.00g014360.m01.CDS01 [Fusarium sp. VM40]
MALQRMLCIACFAPLLFALRTRTISEHGIGKLSSLPSKAQTPAQAIDSFDRELSKAEPNCIPTFLCGTTLETPQNTEFYRQALRRDQHRRKPEELQAIDIAWLDKQWGGPDWLPQDVRLACSQPGVPFEPSAEFLIHMKKITRLAQVNGISLDILWANDGDLRYAATSHLAGIGQKAIVSDYNRLVSGVSRKINKMVADCIRFLPSAPAPGYHQQSSGVANHGKSVCTHGIDEVSLVPGAGAINKQVLKPIRRHSTISDIRKGSMVKQTSQELTDSCREAASRKEQILVASLAPGELQSLRAQAAKHLEEAEAEKAAADFALGNLKGREDQIREIRQHSETYIQNEISGRVPEDSLLNSHVRGDRTVFDTFIQLRDSLLEAYPGNVDQSSSDQLRTNAEITQRYSDAKQRLHTLDHIEKARFMHHSCNEMRDYRKKLRDLVDETGKRLQTMERRVSNRSKVPRKRTGLRCLTVRSKVTAILRVAMSFGGSFQYCLWIG